MPAQAKPVELVGFAADFSPLTPGIFTSCSGLIPTVKGFKPRPAPQAQYQALPSACLGSFVAEYLDGTTRLFAATATHIYEGSNSTWSEIDGSQTFTGGSTSPWRFRMFGNDCIATNGVDAVQVVGKTGNFSALAGSPPTAGLIETLYGFVFLFETDNWHASGIGSDTIWTNSVSQLSASNSLTDTPGPIRGCGKLNRNVVAFKERGIYLGSFVDIPNIWDWNLVEPQAGTKSPDSIINIGNSLAFIGLDDLYLFNGYSATPIQGPNGGPNPIKEWFFANVDENNLQNIVGYFDSINDTVYWWFPSTAANPAGTLDTLIAWNYRTGKWTTDKVNIQAIVQPFYVASSSWTYTKFETTYGTYNGIPNLPYNDALFFGSTTISMAYIDNSGVLNSLTGTPGASSFTTGDYGDGRNYLYLNRIRPAFPTFPSLTGGASLSVTEYSRENLGDTLEQGDTQSLTPHGFVNLRASQAFHRWQFNFQGNYEIESIDPELVPDGEK